MIARTVQQLEATQNEEEQTRDYAFQAEEESLNCTNSPRASIYPAAYHSDLPDISELSIVDIDGPSSRVPSGNRLLRQIAPLASTSSFSSTTLASFNSLRNSSLLDHLFVSMMYHSSRSYPRDRLSRFTSVLPATSLRPPSFRLISRPLPFLTSLSTFHEGHGGRSAIFHSNVSSSYKRLTSVCNREYRFQPMVWLRGCCWKRDRA